MANSKKHYAARPLVQQRYSFEGAIHQLDSRHFVSDWNFPANFITNF